MINDIVNKTIINETPEEYEKLAKIILTSPVEIYSYNKFQGILKQIIEQNKSFLMNRNYAIFFNLKTLVIEKENFSIPSLEKLLEFLNKKFDKALISLLLAEAIDQAVLFYVGNKNEK